MKNIFFETRVDHREVTEHCFVHKKHGMNGEKKHCLVHVYILRAFCL